jgi:hypothetical protein
LSDQVFLEDLVGELVVNSGIGNKESHLVSDVVYGGQFLQDRDHLEEFCVRLIAIPILAWQSVFWLK